MKKKFILPIILSSILLSSCGHTFDPNNWTDQDYVDKFIEKNVIGFVHNENSMVVINEDVNVITQRNAYAFRLCTLYKDMAGKKTENEQVLNVLQNVKITWTGFEDVKNLFRTENLNSGNLYYTLYTPIYASITSNLAIEATATISSGSYSKELIYHFNINV